MKAFFGRLLSFLAYMSQAAAIPDSSGLAMRSIRHRGGKQSVFHALRFTGSFHGYRLTAARFF
jgi:hypothetical protein